MFGVGIGAGLFLIIIIAGIIFWISKERNEDHEVSEQAGKVQENRRRRARGISMDGRKQQEESSFLSSES